ncbi:hypothetical protein ACRAWF_14515 [Streptomyces sp. L7]
MPRADRGARSGPGGFGRTAPDRRHRAVRVGRWRTSPAGAEPAWPARATAPARGAGRAGRRKLPDRCSGLDGGRRPARVHLLRRMRRRLDLAGAGPDTTPRGAVPGPEPTTGLGRPANQIWTPYGTWGRCAAPCRGPRRPGGGRPTGSHGRHRPGGPGAAWRQRVAVRQLEFSALIGTYAEVVVARATRAGEGGGRRPRTGLHAGAAGRSLFRDPDERNSSRSPAIRPHPAPDPVRELPLDAAGVPLLDASMRPPTLDDVYASSG